MQIHASTTLHSAQRDVFVLNTNGSCSSRPIMCRRDDLVPTQPFSFPSLLRQLHDLRKIHSWDIRCVEGASSRSWNRRSGDGAARHRARGAYCGGFWNACALDVGALNLLLNFFRYGQVLCVCAYYVFELSGQIISAGEGCVKD